jgi:hypothetical protein
MWTIKLSLSKKKKQIVTTPLVLSRNYVMIGKEKRKEI